MARHGKPGAGFLKFFLQRGKFPAVQRTTGNERHIATGWHDRLMGAEDLAQAALGARAQDGVPHLGGGSDHADAGGTRGSIGGGREPPEHESPTVGATPTLADGTEVALAPQVLLGAEAHGGRGARRRPAQTTVSRLRPLRRRARMTLRPPGVAMRAR